MSNLKELQDKRGEDNSNICRLEKLILKIKINADEE